MRRLLPLLVPLALLVAACGDDDADDAAGDTTTTTVADGADGDEADDRDEGDEAAEPDADADDDADDAGDDDDQAGTPPETTVAGDDAPAEDAPGEGVHEGDGIDDPGVLLADLRGDAEVPGPGDASARGRFEAELVEGSLCIDMVAEGLSADVTAAHVHEGAAGSSGTPVVDIGTPTSAAGSTDTWTDVCVPVDGPLVERMATEPDRFYVNVHSAAFPDGAVRGQLALASVFDRQLS